MEPVAPESTSQPWRLSLAGVGESPGNAHVAASPRPGPESGTCQPLALSSFGTVTTPDTFRLGCSDSCRHGRGGSEDEDLAGGRGPVLPGWTGQLVSPALSMGTLSRLGRWDASLSPRHGRAPPPALQGLHMRLQDQGQQRALGSPGSRAPAAQAQREASPAREQPGAGGPQITTRATAPTGPCLTRGASSFQRAWTVRWPLSDLQGG